MVDGPREPRPPVDPGHDEIPLLEDVLVPGHDPREAQPPGAMETIVDELWGQVQHQVLEGVRRALNEAGPGIRDALRARLATVVSETRAAEPSDPSG